MRMQVITICVLSAVLAPRALWAASAPAVLTQDFQVIQRDKTNAASFFINVDEIDDQAGDFVVRISTGDQKEKTLRIKSVRSGEGVNLIYVEKVPVGGPYKITVQSSTDDKKSLAFHNVLVGDIWILAGQSNMYGLARLEEALPALPNVNLYDFEHIHAKGRWCAAIPPIHRIPDVFASGILKSQRPGITDEQIQQILKDKQPVGGTDCSYFFARQMVKETGVPIGLVPCAMGGSLALWDPGERDQNRYGFLLRHVQSIGGKVKGMLWYQGEQDAIFGDETEIVDKPAKTKPYPTYGEEFAKFVKAMRQDFDNPQMPVILAQISRHHGGDRQRDSAWEMVRDIQRRLPEQVPHVHCVPAIDLEVMDGIHLDYASHKRLGRRMAFVAVPYVKSNVPKRSEIRLKSVKRFSKTGRPALAVEFDGVTGRLRSAGRPTGFRLRNQETGKDLNWIYRVEFDSKAPHRVILHLSQPATSATSLIYGSGSAPYVNITDDNDMPIPAFGPIDIQFE